MRGLWVCWECWLVSLRGCSPSSSKGHDNWEIPDDWKKGNVTLPFKKGQEGECRELRGSWTSVSGKHIGQTLLEATSRHMKDKEVTGITSRRFIRWFNDAWLPSLIRCLAVRRRGKLWRSFICFVVLFYCFTVNLAKTLASFPVLYSYLWLRYGLDKAMIRQLIELVGLPDSQGGWAMVQGLAGSQ